jgi:hypothetical protein
VFDESPKSEISQWGLEKINYVDFLGIENFLSIFPKQNLDIGFGMLEEILNFRGQERIHCFRKFLRMDNQSRASKDYFISGWCE